MDEEIFSDPLNKIVALCKSTEDTGDLSSSELAQYLWSQKKNFTERLCKLKTKPSTDAKREDIKSKRQFQFHGDIIEVVDQFLVIAFQLADTLSIDEQLACQILTNVINIATTRDKSQLLALCEEYTYQVRSSYLDGLREILNCLNSNIDKSKRDILQLFISELLVPQECLVTILLKLFDEKIRNITVPTNQKEARYRIVECQKIVECLFLISFQFTLKEDLIKSIIIKLRECSKLFSNQQPDSPLYNQLFQITYTILLSIYVVLVEPKVILMNPLENKPTFNNCLNSTTFLKSLLVEITNDWEHNLPIQSALITLYYLLKIKVDANDYESHLAKAFPKDRDGIEFLTRVVDSKSFKNSNLKNLYYFILDEYACSIIQYFPINEKQNYISFLNNFNQFVTNIYNGSSGQSSKKFWEYCENSGYLKSNWFQLPNGLIVSSFKMMASLAISNGIEVYNFFTKDSSQFTWNKIIQHLQVYVDSLNQPNVEISPADTEALNAILCLVTETISYSPQLAKMLARNVQLILLFFRFVTAPVSVALKSTTLRAIAACAKYPAFVPDIWKLLIESKIFPSGLRMESQSSEHGEFPFTQQFLELFYQLIQVSPFLFDRSNDSTMRSYLDHIMELFSSFNNKAFNHIMDKWQFTLTILNIFVYCLGQFRGSVIGRIIDKQHPVYPLYVELTTMSHYHTLQTLIGIIDTAASASALTNTNDANNLLSSTNNELFQNTLGRCLEILLFVSDSSIFSVDDATSIITQFSLLPVSQSPTISIAKLIDHENRDIGLKALRLVYSFEIYTQRMSSLFLGSKSPEVLLDKFVRVMEINEMDQEIDYSNPTNIQTQPQQQQQQQPSYYLEAEQQFQKYAKNSIQWTISQMILYCLDKSASSSNTNNKYTLAHFLLGFPSIYDLDADFEKHTRTCLTTILKKVSDVEFVRRFPHLVDCYHQIIYMVISTNETMQPMVKFLPQSYYQDNLVLLKNRIANSKRSERVRDAHLSSLSWLLKSMAIALHNCHDPLIKNYFMSLLVGNTNNAGINKMAYIQNQQSQVQQLEVLQIFNCIEFEFPELTKPKIFEMIPLLESSCLTNWRDCQIINLEALLKFLESDSRLANLEPAVQMASCAKLNAAITFIDTMTRVLEGWKLFVNEALLQSEVISTMNEIIPLTLLQRLIVEFANEKYPITCGISIGYTILNLLYVLNIKKDSFQLIENFNDILEPKVKGIFEGLIQTIYKSNYQPIRGIAYTCIIKYLQLTQSFEQFNKQTNTISESGMDILSSSKSMISSSASMMTLLNIKSIEKHNITLLNKVDDRLLKVLLNDCHSFSSGWKIAATTCLELLVSMDVVRANRTIKSMDDRGIIGALIGQCTTILRNSFGPDATRDWQGIDPKELRVYDSQMSLLLKVSQQIDGIRMLMAANVVGVLANCSFFSYVPNDGILSSTFISLLTPALRLLCSLFHVSHERLDIYQQVQSFIGQHSDLFKFILQDAYQPTSSTLTILQLTVHLFTQTSSLPLNYHDKSQTQFNRFHYSLLGLFTKYTRSNLKYNEIKEDREDYQDDQLQYKIDFSNNNKEQSVFTTSMEHLITMICRDLVLYCKRVCIVQDSKFGSVCFGPTIKSSVGFVSSSSINGNNNFISTTSQSMLPTMDVAIRYLRDSLIEYYQSLSSIEFIKQSMENLNTITPNQLKNLLSDEQFYQDLNIDQRNKMLNKKLNQLYIDRCENSNVLLECIESLLLVIMTHSYYYTVSIGNLFAFNPQPSQAALGYTYNSMGGGDMDGQQQLQITSSSQPLELSDLQNHYSTPIKQQSQDIFLTQPSPKPQQQTPMKMVSSVFSYLKGMTNTPVSKQPQQSFSSSVSNPSTSLLKSMVQQQTQFGTGSVSLPHQGELSQQESREYLSKLRNSFEMELPILQKRLFDSLYTLPRKTTLIDLLLKKLQEIFTL